jgi:hypothetical protein
VPQTTGATGLSQTEVQTLRHLIGDVDTSSKKLRTYAEQCQNSELRNWVHNEAQSAEKCKQNLLSFLG